MISVANSYGGGIPHTHPSSIGALEEKENSERRSSRIKKVKAKALFADCVAGLRDLQANAAQGRRHNTSARGAAFPLGKRSGGGDGFIIVDRKPGAKP